MATNDPIIYGHRDADTRASTRSEGDILAKREQRIAKRAFDELWKAYPNHLWKTKVQRVDQRGGYILCIQIGILMDEARWFTIPDERLGTENEFVRMCKEAGGHILERFGLGRGVRVLDDFLHVRQTKRLWSPKDRMPT